MNTCLRFLTRLFSQTLGTVLARLIKRFCHEYPSEGCRRWVTSCEPGCDSLNHDQSLHNRTFFLFLENPRTPIVPVSIQQRTSSKSRLITGALKIFRWQRFLKTEKLRRINGCHIQGYLCYKQQRAHAKRARNEDQLAYCIHNHQSQQSKRRAQF